MSKYQQQMREAIKINADLISERDKLREQVAFLTRFADAPDMETGKTTRDTLRAVNAELVTALEALTAYPFTVESLEQARVVLARAKARQS